MQKQFIITLKKQYISKAEQLPIVADFTDIVNKFKKGEIEKWSIPIMYCNVGFKFFDKEERTIIKVEKVNSSYLLITHDNII